MDLDPFHLPALDPSPRSLRRPVAVDEIPTPALVLDQAALAHNLNLMVELAARHGKSLRPHAKTHKCPIIGHQQMEAGAVGLCCAKVSEAEVMVAAGLDHLLITSPVVSQDKVERVVDLLRHAPESMLVVDSELGVERLESAARAARTQIRVLIDLDPDTHRTGIAMGEPAIALARRITASRELELWGLQAYAGHLMHLQSYRERRERALDVWRRVAETRHAIEGEGIALPILTGGGTGTFEVDCEVDGVTDLQVGSYLFMDRQYREIESASGTPLDTFLTALTVVSTAISQPVPHLITTDAGYKAFATDGGKPELLDFDGVVFHWGGDEHGILQLKEASRPIGLGDRLRFRVPHCDPTVNLYDHYWPARDGVVRELWPIAARGRSQ